MYGFVEGFAGSASHTYEAASSGERAASMDKKFSKAMDLNTDAGMG